MSLPILGQRYSDLHFAVIAVIAVTSVMSVMLDAPGMRRAEASDSGAGGAREQAAAAVANSHA